MSPIKVGMSFGTYDSLARKYDIIYRDHDRNYYNKRHIFSDDITSTTQTDVWKNPKVPGCDSLVKGVKALSINKKTSCHGQYASMDVIHHLGNGKFGTYFHYGTKRVNDDIIFNEIHYENIMAYDYNGNGIVDPDEILDTGD